MKVNIEKTSINGSTRKLVSNWFIGEDGNLYRNNPYENVKQTIDENNEKWYIIKVHGNALRDWITQQHNQLWKPILNNLFSIHQKLYTILVLKWNES